MDVDITTHRDGSTKVYDSATSWMMSVGPRDEHELNERQHASHATIGRAASDRPAHRSTRRMPRWIRFGRPGLASAALPACCAAA